MHNSSLRLLCAPVASLGILLAVFWGWTAVGGRLNAAPSEEVPATSAGALPASASAGAAGAGPSSEAQSLQPLEARLLELLNEERVRHGLAALQVDPRLVSLARQRSSDMIARNYFGHVMPEGRMVFSLMEREGIPYRLAGENLARNSHPPDRSPEVAHNGFMNSPSHRENELEPSFSRVGIGVAVAPTGSIYFTELFTAW